jgi:hypothetical protein
VTGVLGRFLDGGAAAEDDDVRQRHGLAELGAHLLERL